MAQKSKIEIKVDGKKIAVRRGEYEVEGEVGSTTLTVYDMRQRGASPRSFVVTYEMTEEGFSYIIGDFITDVWAFETKAMDLLEICRDELRATS